MFTSITFPTALSFWLTFPNTIPLTLYYKSQPKRPFDASYKEILLNTAHLFQIEEPLHIMVPTASLRNRGDRFISHVMPKGLPAGSFMNLTEDVQIISPELCFLLAAQHLDIPELAVLGCDFCAKYVKSDYYEFGQTCRTPITTAKKLSSYLRKVGHVDGIVKARKAVEAVLDRSNSPMESRIGAIGCLRLLYGGYSLMKPELNDTVVFSPTGAALIGREQCSCDMVWREQKVVAEYDSDLSHMSKDQMHYDKIRTNALQLSGYTVISLTRDRFASFSKIEESYLLLKKLIGQRVNWKLMEKYEEKRRETVRRIFWSSYGAESIYGEII